MIREEEGEDEGGEEKGGTGLKKDNTALQDNGQEKDDKGAHESKEENEKYSEFEIGHGGKRGEEEVDDENTGEGEAKESKEKLRADEEDAENTGQGNAEETVEGTGKDDAEEVEENLVPEDAEDPREVGDEAVEDEDEDTQRGGKGDAEEIEAKPYEEVETSRINEKEATNKDKRPKSPDVAEEKPGWGTKQKNVNESVFHVNQPNQYPSHDDDRIAYQVVALRGI